MSSAKDDNIKYSLGSVLNHVLMHQTVIGLEARKQFELAGDFPDIVIASFGGGSNFAGLSFPFLEMNFCEGKNIRCIASEPASCPKLTRGEFKYDFGDTVGFTPLIPMYTLGHNFVPAPEANHAIATAVSEALRCKEEWTSKTILFNLCGHGHFDMKAYADYLDGTLVQHEVSDADIAESLANSEVMDK